MGSVGSEARPGRVAGSLSPCLHRQGCLGKVSWHGRGAEPGETPQGCCVAGGRGWRSGEEPGEVGDKAGSSGQQRGHRA